MSGIDDLEQLERRVREKWATEAVKRIDPQWKLDVGQWTIPDTPDGLVPLPPDVIQFPREQWASYPNTRTLALMACDRMLDFDELSDEQWMTLCLVMQYGGKTRIA